MSIDLSPLAAPKTGQGRLVIIAAGGTGGHMFPAAAFAAEMRLRGWQVGLVSDDRGLTYAAQFPADWKEAVKAASPNLRKPLSLPGTAFRLFAGYRHAVAVMKRKKPCLIAGFGGYPAFPTLAAARRLTVPFIIHEQNAVLGRVNRRFARHACSIASGFENLAYLPASVPHHPIGNPVRADILAERANAYPDLGQKITLLITGGSQGSQIFGDILPLAITQHIPQALRSRLRIVQQVRETQLESVKKIYGAAGIECVLKPFFDDMPKRLVEAHLVIARSGAGTISELAAIGRPSLLIPLKIAMDDHQRLNADMLVAAGAAELMTEDELTPLSFGELLTACLNDESALEQRAGLAKSLGRVNAAEALADLAEHHAGGVQ